MSMLGLDIGTTGVKAVAFRNDGTFITSAYKEYDLLSPRPGHLELDPAEVLAAIQEVTNSVAQQTKDDPVRSVGACTLGEAAVPMGADGKPVGNAIVGFDSRGDEEAAAFRKKITNSEVFEIAGHGINSYHTLFKILWRKQHEKSVFDAAKKYLCFGDFAMSCMGIPPRMDYAIAARTLAFDIHRLEWSQPILDAAGLSTDLFPPPVAPGEPVGEIGAEAAAAFGLPKGCVIAGGIHDQPAGILGAGVMPGESMLAIGTTICLGVRLKGKPTGQAMVDNNLCYYPTVGDRQYISIAYNFTGGSLLKWYRDNLAGDELVEAKKRGVDPYEVIISGMPEGPTGLFVLPHFTTTGTPWLDPKALGAVLGLRLTSSRKEIVKAILEGILYEIRLNGELLRASGVEVELYKVIGGATKSETWMQIAADILGRPVAITSVGEGAALGAALMGGLATGAVPSLDAMYELVRNSAKVERLLKPNAENTRKYSERFEVYKDLYPKTKDLSHKIFDLTSTP